METTPPQLNVPPPAKDNSNDKLLAILCHVSPMIGVGIVLPLIIYLVKKGESEFIASHAREALNFHITVIIAAVCCIPLIFLLCIGYFLLMAVAVGSFVLGIVAAIKVSDGQFYRYPLCLRLI